MPVKRPDRVLSVALSILQQRPTLRAAIVGSGPLMDELKEEAQRLGLESNVEFLGHVERVEDVVRRAKTFILTSRSEGLSIALAEAMAAGAVPVVADVGELGDLVLNGKTGWRISQADVAGYANRIAQILADDGSRHALSGAASADRAVTVSMSHVSDCAPCTARTFSRNTAVISAR